MDVSVRTTMKGAAKCDKHCELQDSVNRQELERILCFWDIPESMPSSVSVLCCSSGCNPSRGMLLRLLVPQDVHVGAPEVFDGQGFASIANSLSISMCALSCVSCCECVAFLRFGSVPSSQDMK